MCLVAEIEFAVAVYREALQERTRERDPQRWAAIQNSLGIALRQAKEALAKATAEARERAEAEEAKRVVEQEALAQVAEGEHPAEQPPVSETAVADGAEAPAADGVAEMGKTA